MYNISSACNVDMLIKLGKELILLFSKNVTFFSWNPINELITEFPGIYQSYGFYLTDAYVYMTNKPESLDQLVSLHDEVGSEEKSTNYQIMYNGL